MHMASNLCYTCLCLTDPSPLPLPAPALQIFSQWQLARAMAASAPHWPDVMIIAAHVLGLQDQEPAQT